MCNIQSDYCRQAPVEYTKGSLYRWSCGVTQYKLNSVHGTDDKEVLVGLKMINSKSGGRRVKVGVRRAVGCGECDVGH